MASKGTMRWYASSITALERGGTSDGALMASGLVPSSL
ncbi:hypothetical protein URH17368_0184 [Alicyclobacillus hesperidum URH17-3-68]|nr:hypothetical protein URH17368_0184 [Alicyclobacillus hesperidum URH17-3-68]